VDDFRSGMTVGDVVNDKNRRLGIKPKEEVTLTQAEIHNLAETLHNGGHLNFTNLANKRAVAKHAKALGIKTFSHTAHGSLLDPRYTVEGRDIPDRGFANDYRHYTPKLYCLETRKDGW